MSLGRTFRKAALVAILSVAIAVLGYELFYLHWLRSVVVRGHRLLLETSAETLDHDLRAALPPGASRAAVETALRNRHLEFGYNQASHEIEAGARYLKGSNPLIESGLSMQFHFDNNEALTNIDSRVIYTGS